MSQVHPTVSPKPATFLSRVTNGSRLLDGVDGRSAMGRRYRDLAMNLADDLGGADKLTAAQKALVRHAAAVTIESERMHAAILNGQHVDSEELTRTTNSLTRLMRELGRGVAKAQEDTLPDLASYIGGQPA